MSGAKGTVVITGAGSGIGRALTALCAERGYDLVLYDINGEELESSAETARAKGAKVSSRILDVSDEGAISQAAEEVAQEQGAIRMLFNNAGVALGGMFDDYTPADYKWLMDINFYGVVNMTRAFLPLLKKYEGRAQLVNVSSVFGIIAPPGQTAYSAAKFAVRGFSEALRHELQDTNVGVTVVHPGGVATNIAKRARVSESVPKEQHEAALKRAEKSLSMPPPRAAEIILGAAERGDGRILVGKDARILTAITKAFPITYWKILQKIPGLTPPERQQSGI